MALQPDPVGYTPELYTVASGSSDLAPIVSSYYSVTYPQQSISIPNFMPYTKAQWYFVGKLIDVNVGITIDLSQPIPPGANTDEYRIKAYYNPGIRGRYNGLPTPDAGLPLPMFRSVCIVNHLGQLVGNLPGANQNLVATLLNTGDIKLSLETINVNPHVITPLTRSLLAPYFSQPGTAIKMFIRGSYLSA